MSVTLQSLPRARVRAAAPRRRIDGGGSASVASNPRVDLNDAQLHVPRLLHVARRILGSDDLAWDAVQDALILLWHEQRPPPDLPGWLVRTVVHRSLHHERTLRRRRVHEQRGGVAAWEVRGSEDPARSVENLELAALVAEAIEALPHDFAAPLRLRDIDGLEYEQIAARLELPVGTVRSRLHRARARLRSLLADLVHEHAACWICEGEDHPRPR